MNKKQKKMDIELPEKHNASMATDLAMLAMVTEFVIMLCFDMFVRNDLFGNLLCTIITLFLVVITYFIGLVPALATSLIFLLVLILESAREFVTGHHFVGTAFFWTIWPPLICITFYILTVQLRKLQGENLRLQNRLNQASTLDSETNLRTVEIFREHFHVFTNLSKDYHFPLYLFSYRIKYWNSISGILSRKEQHHLIQVVTEVINDVTTGHEFVYSIGNQPPTWAVLSSEAVDSNKRRFRDEVKQELAQRVNDDSLLNKVDIQLEASRVQYDPQEHPDASSFLQDGIHELQYDVSAGSVDNR